MEVVSYTCSDEDLGKQVVGQLERLGFFYLTDVSSVADPSALRSAAQKFFQLEPEEKRRIALRKYRGYSGLGSEVTLGRRDWHECIDFGEETQAPDVFGVNQFPNADFEAEYRSFYANMNSIGARLMRVILSETGLQAADMDLDRPFSLLRILNYPIIDGASEEASENTHLEIGIGIGEHSDYGFLTLVHSNQPGLEVQTPSGDWIPALAGSDVFVVNIGDALSNLSGGRLRATKHRVRHSQDRLSLAFFFEPAFETIIPRKDGDSYRYGDYLLQKYAQSYPSTI